MSVRNFAVAIRAQKLASASADASAASLASALTALAAANAAAAAAVDAKNNAIQQVNLATAAASAAASAGLLSGTYPNTYAGVLPYGVTDITGGLGTGTGGTPGTYAGGVIGGPANFAWFYVIGTDGTINDQWVDNSGLATTNAVPVLSYPSGGITGATVPVATVDSLVPPQGTYWAATADSQGLALWKNSAGASVAVNNPDGTQIAVYGKGGVDAAVAQFSAQVQYLFPDDGYAAGFFGADGYPILAALAGGGLVGLVGNIPAADYIFPDDDYVFALVGSDGSVAYGVSFSAPTSAYNSLMPVLETDNSLRLMSDTLDIKIAAPQGTILTGAKIVGTQLKWIDKQGSTRERRQFNLTAFAKGAYTKIVMVPMIGQSLSVGYKSGALYTTSAVAPGRALMFNGGARPLPGPTWANGVDNSRVLADTQVATLVDLVESLVGLYGETHLSGAGYWLNKPGVVEGTSALLFDTVGLGGAPLSSLWKGTQNYANFIRAVERGKAIADYAGLSFEVPCVLMDQGESDYGASSASYLTNLLQLQADLTTDINAITGGTGQVKLLCWSPSSWTAASYALTTAGSPIGVTDGALNYPTRIGAIGPQYFNTYWDVDGVHALSRGLRTFGEYEGRAVAAVRGGGSTGGLFATSAAVVGTALTVTFNANIALDTTLVSDPGQYGVRLFNGASEIALSGIVVSGNQLTATVASAPGAGSWKIGIADKGIAGNAAGPTTGPRSNIRDASADLASDGATHLYNWALHQQIACSVS